MSLLWKQHLVFYSTWKKEVIIPMVLYRFSFASQLMENALRQPPVVNVVILLTPQNTRSLEMEKEIAADLQDEVVTE